LTNPLDGDPAESAVDSGGQVPNEHMPRRGTTLRLRGTADITLWISDEASTRNATGSPGWLR
jgi:hypothetical protein